MSVLACETPAMGPSAAFAARLQAMLPVIETARLRLRAPRIEDFAHYAEIVVGPRGVHILETPERDEAWYDFANMVAAWTLRGHGLWTVEDRADATVLGFVLLGFEPGDHEPELGFMFRTRAEGRGLAAEAARAAQTHAFGALGLTTLVSTIDPDNTRSIALAKRLGGRRDAAAEAAHDHKIRVYRYSAPTPEGTA